MRFLVDVGDDDGSSSVKRLFHGCCSRQHLDLEEHDCDDKNADHDGRDY